MFILDFPSCPKAILEVKQQLLQLNQILFDFEAPSSKLTIPYIFWTFWTSSLNWKLWITTRSPYQTEEKCKTEKGTLKKFFNEWWRNEHSWHINSIITRKKAGKDISITDYSWCFNPLSFQNNSILCSSNSFVEELHYKGEREYLLSLCFICSYPPTSPLQIQ